MLTLAQLSQLSGVSRRTLQDYDAMGLLKHHETTAGGYWLYAEEDADRLQLIQLLRRSGCTRKELLPIFSDASATPLQLLERVREALLTRRERINQLLQHVDMARLRLLQQEQSEGADDTHSAM